MPQAVFLMLNEMNIFLVSLLFLGLIETRAMAATIALNLSQPQDKVQKQNGKEQADPISPGLSLGPHFDINETWQFAPELGYILNQVSTKDHYGGKPKIETFYLLYDFVYSLSAQGSWKLRAGIGNFIKKTKGDGGTVSVPNGTSGTSTAYKPGKTKTSYTSSVNLGTEWYFSEGTPGEFFKNYRLFGEIFTFEPLDKQKRMYTLQIGIGANI